MLNFYKVVKSDIPRKAPLPKGAASQKPQWERRQYYESYNK